MKCAIVAPHELTDAPITANVKPAATIPALAAPEPTPTKPMAVAIPTEDIGDTINKAINTRTAKALPVDSVIAVKGPINPAIPNPAEKAVPSTIINEATPPEIAAASTIGKNNFGRDNKFAI